MIFNVTYTDKKTIDEINALVGPPFSFLDRMRKRGIGSERFSISEMSEGFADYRVGFEDENYCNIELRPGGIIVRFSRILERFAWCIPYYQLAVYQNGRQLSIFRNAEFIKMSPQGPGKKSSPFARKILDEKNHYLTQKHPRL